MWSNNKTIPEEVKEMNALVIRNQNLQESQRIMLVISLRRKQVNGLRKSVSSLIIVSYVFMPSSQDLWKGLGKNVRVYSNSNTRTNSLSCTKISHEKIKILRRIKG
jgi:hypothetical protein